MAPFNEMIPFHSLSKKIILNIADSSSNQISEASIILHFHMANKWFSKFFIHNSNHLKFIIIIIIF